MGEPRHIHVSGHSGQAKVWLEPIEMAASVGYNSAELKRIMDVIRDHQSQFVEAWNEFAKSVS
jgi:hypothetical protein